jgi:hypothetical protein
MRREPKPASVRKPIPLGSAPPGYQRAPRLVTCRHIGLDSIPFGPGTEETMFRYKLHWADGSEAGEAEYAITIKAGELIWIRGNRQVRVLDLVPVEEEDSPYAGLPHREGGDRAVTVRCDSCGKRAKVVEVVDNGRLFYAVACKRCAHPARSELRNRRDP